MTVRSSAAVVHIAGHVVEIDARLRQRCAWCGALLVDHDRSAVVSLSGEQTVQAEAWAPGSLVEKGMGWTASIPLKAGDKLPANACFQLDPAVTA